MTFTEIVAEVAAILNLTSTEALTRIGQKVNDRHRRVTSTIGLVTTRRTTITGTAVIGVSEIVFDSAERLINVVDRLTTRHRVLDEVSVEELRARAVPTRTTPSCYAILSTTAGSVTILVDCVPTTAFSLYADAFVNLSTLSGSQEPVFAESFHDILVYGVLADEYRKLMKRDLARDSETMYERRVSDLRMFLASSSYKDFYQGKTKNVSTSFGASGSSGGTPASLFPDSFFGAHDISAGGVGANDFFVRNTSPGTINYASVRVGNDTGGMGGLYAWSSAFAAVGQHATDGLELSGIGVGGLTLSADNAGGVIRFYTGSPAVFRGQFDASGGWLTAFAESNTNFVAAASITSNQNNYNPTGLSTARSILVSSDASRDVTGLVAQASGRVITLINIGVPNLVLKHLSASSSAANRFTCPDAKDFVLKNFSSVTLKYVTNVWYVQETSAFPDNNFGDHNVTSGGTGVNRIVVTNTTAGVANYASVQLANDSGGMGGLYGWSSTFTPIGAHAANGIELASVFSGGLSLSAEHSGGVINLHTGSSSLRRAQVAADGTWTIGYAETKTGFVTPSQITSNQNNYSPTSLSIARTLLLSSDASRDLTGMAAQENGRIIRLINVGAQNIVLKHASGSSTATNQFACPGAGDFTLNTKDSVEIQYVTNLWYVLGF